MITNEFRKYHPYGKVKGWMKGSVIIPSDESGMRFISTMLQKDPSLLGYIWNARNNMPYDFKVTNCMGERIDGLDPYRGMPISKDADAVIYTSARDVGNIMAGYIAGSKGLAWHIARSGFDMYQSLSEPGMGCTPEGVWEFYDEDNNQINKNLFLDMVSSYLSELMTTNTGSSLVKELVEHYESVYILAGKNGYDSSKKAVGFNPINVESVPVEGGMNSDFSATFIHELAHALYDISGGETKQWFTVPQGENYKVVNISEIFTTHVENKFRAENELPLRTYYAKNEYNQPYGPPIVAPGTRQSRYYKSDGTTNYKILKRKETPYEY